MIINDKRALCYSVKVGKIDPIEGADNIALAHVGGWPIIVKKNEFNEGDLAVFFEIDSKLPEEERYAFLANKHYKIKTMKLNKFGVFSQGLLMPITDFPEIDIAEEHIDLTDILKVKYADPEDNARKSKIDPNAKYTSMKARHKKFFSNPMVKKLMRYDWFKKFIFIFLGKKKDAPKAFPSQFPYIKVSDEERVENMPWILENNDPWIKTTKIDGTSSTYILEKKKNWFGKNKYEEYVCSRHVRQLDRNQENFHSSIGDNVYWAIADKYKIFNFLQEYLEKNNLNYVCIQGEIAGPGLQGNPHKFSEIQFFGFNLIRSDIGRINSVEAKNICLEYDIPWVPIVDENYYLPKDFDEFKLSADGPCEAPGASGLREGYVYRAQDGKMSFKSVSRQYLLKH